MRSSLSHVVGLYGVGRQQLSTEKALDSKVQKKQGEGELKVGGFNLRRQRVAQTLDERCTDEHFREDLLDVFDVDKANAGLHALRYVLLDIGAVRSGRKDGLDTGSMRGQDLLLESADGEDLAHEGDLARHGDVWADGRLGEERDKGGEQRRARARPFLADAPLGHVYVHVPVVQYHRRRVVRHAKRMRVRFGPA